MKELGSSAVMSQRRLFEMLYIVAHCTAAETDTCCGRLKKVNADREATTSRNTKRGKERLHPGVVERGLETRSREVGSVQQEAHDSYRMKKLHRLELLEVGVGLYRGEEVVEQDGGFMTRPPGSRA